MCTLWTEVSQKMSLILYLNFFSLKGAINLHNKETLCEQR